MKLAGYLERANFTWITRVKIFSSREMFHIIPGKRAMLKRLETILCTHMLTRTHTLPPLAVLWVAEGAVHFHRLLPCAQRKCSRHLNISKPNKTSWRILLLWPHYLLTSVFLKIKRKAEASRATIDRSRKGKWRRKEKKVNILTQAVLPFWGDWV